MLRTNKNATLTPKVRYDKNLTNDHKIFLMEIVAHTNEHGALLESNGTLAQFYNVSRSTITRWIHTLGQQGYIRVKLDKKNNSIVKREIIANFQQF